MLRVMRQRRDLTSVQREPGLQQATTPGVRTLLWLLTQRVAAACSKLVRMLRPGAWLAGALRGLHSIFTAITTVMYPKRRHLLAWVRSQLPTREIADLSAVWRDGGLLCALVETAVSPDPRLCCHLAKYRGANSPSLRLGQRLAAEYLQVPPAFTEAELELSPTPAVISRLADYLTALKHASQKLHELKFEKVSPKLPKFVAKGMGLFMAVKGRNATFSVFPSGRRTLFPTLGIGATSLTIIIRGPDRECERIEVTPRGAQAKSKSESSCRIPISVVTSTEACRVTYKPQSVGLHEVFLQYQEINLANSPYRVNVEAVNVLPETPVRNENKLRNMRIVDFIDEKHILTETGKLIPLPKDTTSLPSSASKNISFRGRVKHVVTRRKLIGLKKSKFKSFDETNLSPVNDKCLEKQSSSDSKSDFKDTCKRILTVCDFLLKSNNKSETLNIINTAEQILSSSPDLIIKRNLNPTESVQFIENEDTKNNENATTDDEGCRNEMAKLIDNKGYVLCHRGSEPIEIHRKGCDFLELDRIVSAPFDLKSSSPRKVLENLSRNENDQREKIAIEEESESMISKDTAEVQNFSKIDKASEIGSSENEESTSEDIAIDAMNIGLEVDTISDELENFETPSFEAKVKEWMGPAEREIWENELRWYEEVGEDLTQTCGEIETMSDVLNVTEEQANINNLTEENTEISEQEEDDLLENVNLTAISDQSHREESKLISSSRVHEQYKSKKPSPSPCNISSPIDIHNNTQILGGSETINNNEKIVFEDISKEIFDDANLDAQYLEILKSYEENNDLVQVDFKSEESIEKSQTETCISNVKDSDVADESVNISAIETEYKLEENISDVAQVVRDLPCEDLCIDNQINNLDAIKIIQETKKLNATPLLEQNIITQNLDVSIENDEPQDNVLDSSISIIENTVTEILPVSEAPNINIDENKSEPEIKSEIIVKELGMSTESTNSIDEDKASQEKHDVVSDKVERNKRGNQSPRNSTGSVVDATRRLSLSLGRLSSIQDDEPLRVPEYLQLLSHSPDIASLGSSRVLTPSESPNVFEGNRTNEVSFALEIVDSAKQIENIINTVGNSVVEVKYINSASNELNESDVSKKLISEVHLEDFKITETFTENQQDSDSQLVTVVEDHKNKSFIKADVVIHTENKTADDVLSQPDVNSNVIVEVERAKHRLLSESNGHDSLTNILEELERERNLHHSEDITPDVTQRERRDSLVTPDVTQRERRDSLVTSDIQQRERRDSLVMKRKQFWDSKISQNSVENQQVRSRKNSTDSLYYANVVRATPTLTPTPDLGTSRPNSPFSAIRKSLSNASKSDSPNDNIIMSLNSERLNNITQQIINFEKNKELSHSSTNKKSRRKYSQPHVFQSTKSRDESHPLKTSASLSLRLKYDSSSCDDVDSERDISTNVIHDFVRPSARNHDQMLFKRGSLSMKRDSVGLKRNSDLQRQTETQDYGDVRISNNLTSEKCTVKNDSKSQENFEKEANNSFEERIFESPQKNKWSSPKKIENKSKHFANVSAKFESVSKEEKQTPKRYEVKRTENKNHQKDVSKKVENKFYAAGKMIMNSNSMDFERHKQPFIEKRIKSYEEVSRNESSQEGNEFHSVKYTTTAAKVAIVPSRRNSKALMRPTLLSQFSIEISPDLAIETNSVNPLCDMVDAEPEVEPNKKLETISVNPAIDMVDSEPKVESTIKTNKKSKIKSEESRDRFESAKNFFKNLEKGVAVNKSRDPKTRSRSESARIARKSVEPAVHFSSVRQPRLAERFHVKDLFRDIIEDKAVNARGIPNREAAVASLNSVSVPPLLPAVVTKPFSSIIEDSIAEIF